MWENELILFGKHVKRFREKQGLSKTQLAFEMETGEKYIRELEKGKINITLKNALKLAYCLNISIQELFDFEQVKID